MGTPGEGRPFPPGYPHHQPHEASTLLEEKQAARQAEWEARDLDAEAVLNGMWAATHLSSDLTRPRVGAGFHVAATMQLA